MGFAKNNHKNKPKKKELHQENHFFNIPASNPVRLIMNTIKAINERETPVESIDKINDMQKGIDRHIQYIASIEKSEHEENLFIQYVTAKKDYEAEYFLSLRNIFNFQKSSGNIAKFFIYLLAEINHRATNRGKEIIKGEIEFNAAEIAKTLNYSNSNEAKKAAKKAFESIADVSVRGYEIIKDSRGRIKKNKSV